VVGLVVTLLVVAGAVDDDFALFAGDVAIFAAPVNRTDHKVFSDFVSGADLICDEALLVHKVGIGAPLQQDTCYFDCATHRAVVEWCVALAVGFF